ncbi:hypothetical protein EHQ76_08700 [Leptospira barantonii]|uniref:Uncharacterized protein n=1 Tax=Leptospira barantonii TaxID=2023184 RepID=A0A5F2BDS0_9LEPT|nr:hypothetical protein [Leptospira barantonii]TGM03715.1 hypothetical protein EHQ76_08700 [Leptospira barantonii]
MQTTIKMIAYIGIIYFTFFQCKAYETEQKNDEHTSLILETMVVTDIYFYRYNCPAYTLLDAGTTTIHLNQGEEYWFDFKSRALERPNHYTFRVQVQEATGQEIKFSPQTCLVNRILSEPKSSPSNMNPNFFPDSGLTGQLETFNLSFFSPVEGSTVMTIKSVSGSGNVTITIPNGPI